MTVDSNSILDSIKQFLGIDSAVDVFDLSIIISINSAFSTLTQLGVGPVTGFSITDKSAKWVDFIGDLKIIESVKSYVYIKTRLLFDPPTTSFAIAAFEKQAEEIGWRLNVSVENIIEAANEATEALTESSDY